MSDRCLHSLRQMRHAAADPDWGMHCLQDTHALGFGHHAVSPGKMVAIISVLMAGIGPGPHHVGLPEKGQSDCAAMDLSSF